MVLRAGGTHYEPIAWDDAFALIARHLNALDSPDQAIFYTSGKTSNEAAFAYQLFVRAFGTNNLPDCSNMCHESTSVALAEVDRHRQGLGHASTTSTTAELIVIAGQNPGTNHPRMLTALEKAKRNGATDHRGQPAPGGRAWSGSRTRRRRAASSARAPPSPTCTCRSGSTATSRSSRRSAPLLLEWDAVDHDFVERHTTGLRGVGRRTSRRSTGTSYAAPPV